MYEARNTINIEILIQAYYDTSANMKTYRLDIGRSVNVSNEVSKNSKKRERKI